MRFIKFNFTNKESFSFCLDHLYTFESIKNNTKIILTDGRTETLPIDIEDFCLRVFSDEYGNNEYQLIEIDNDRSQFMPGPTDLVDS